MIVGMLRKILLKELCKLTPCLGISSSTVAGSALILPSEIYNASKTLQCIQDYKCTAIYGVPTMFVTEMEKPEFDSIDRYG